MGLRGLLLGSCLWLASCSTPGTGEWKALLDLKDPPAGSTAAAKDKTSKKQDEDSASKQDDGEAKKDEGSVKAAAYVSPDPTAPLPEKSHVAETVPAPAESGPLYGLPDVIQATLEHHPALRVRRQEVEAARARLITAGLLPNPQVVLDTVGELGENETQLSARLMFTVPLTPKRRWRTAAACAAITVEQLALSRETRLLLLEAADAALEVRYLQEQAALEKERTDQEQRLVAIQKDLFEAATAPYRNVVLAALSTGNAELTRRESAARLAQAQVRLARAMGCPETHAASIQDPLVVEAVPVVPLDTVLNRVLEVAPELAQSQALVCQSQQQLGLERANAVPDLSIGPRSRTSFGDTSEQRLGGRVAMDVPLFDRNQGRIAESAALVDGSCARVAVAENMALCDVQAAYRALYDAQARWDYYRTALRPQMEQVERLLREAFEDRSVPAYDVSALLAAFARMKLTELELRYQHQRWRTRLELLLECRLTDLAGAAPATGAETPPAPRPAKDASGS